LKSPESVIVDSVALWAAADVGGVVRSSSRRMRRVASDGDVDVDVDVDAENAGQDGGGESGGELERCSRLPILEYTVIRPLSSGMTAPHSTDNGHIDRWTFRPPFDARLAVDYPPYDFEQDTSRLAFLGEGPFGLLLSGSLAMPPFVPDGGALGASSVRLIPAIGALGEGGLARRSHLFATTRVVRQRARREPRAVAVRAVRSAAGV
jgi:hypothetical protein